MQSGKLKQYVIDRDLTPTIFAYADANHYLVGAEDDKGNFFSLSDDKEITITFNSICEAEHCLKNMGFTQAILHMQTAYDEMIGNDESNHARLAVNLTEH